MLLGFDEICRKEVIDMVSGERLGFIDDIEIDTENGSVESLIIYGGARLFGLLGRAADTVISCADIRVIGDEVVLVERTESSAKSNSTKRSRNRVLSLLK
ncbi:MAG: YlmC/YmxH family sporulation protein [Ruminococcus sp.]|uniref:YlmC/YmxH family sporulation protein n=1 Tax=Ruminococcus sp. TaxID=41978 RepID=UPI001B3EADB8|nr:YlmC/YmxH family sporulation protein [Ruminococcus sp.]MBP5578622.1 YlmC/YmxH family sporulation protein [Ruminococcus sp.]